LLEAALALHAGRRLGCGRLTGLQSGAWSLRRHGTARLRRHDSSRLRRCLSGPLWLRLRCAARRSALAAARGACRLSRALLSLLPLALTCARRARLYRAALSLPLRRLCALPIRRAGLLLAGTVVLARLAVRPLRLLP
jgi:hypothetical protein